MLRRILKRRRINSLALVSLLVLVGCSFFLPVPWWAYALIAFGWIVITAFGSFFIGWNYHLDSLHQNQQTMDAVISLTFDDGPDPKFTPQVLELLKIHGATATFFCIGKHIEKYPDIVERILSEGHSIGNHTYSHSNNFGFFSSKKVMDELLRTKTLVREKTGRNMNLYRPAFGVTNPQIEKAVKQLGLQSIGWSVRSLDTTSRSENSILKRITTKVAKGDIVLMHDTSAKTLAVLERLLVFLEDNKLKSVTVERLLQIEAYE